MTLQDYRNSLSGNSSYAAAEEKASVAAQQLHDVLNGDAETQVVTDTGLINSLRKAIADNFYFLHPIDWEVNGTEINFNQPRKWTDPANINQVSFWSSPSATSKNPVKMGGNPFNDKNWQPWLNGNTEATAVISWDYTAVGGETVITIPFDFKVINNIYKNGSILNPDPKKGYTYDSTALTVTLVEPLAASDILIMQFSASGGVVPALIDRFNSLYADTLVAAEAAKEEADRAEAVTDLTELSAAVKRLQSANDAEEIVKVVEVTGSTVDISPNDVKNQELTLVSGSTELRLLALDKKCRVKQLMLIIKQGAGGGKKITFSPNVHTGSGVSSPILSFEANAIDVLVLTTLDNGVTWYVSPFLTGI